MEKFHPTDLNTSLMLLEDKETTCPLVTKYLVSSISIAQSTFTNEKLILKTVSFIYAQVNSSIKQRYPPSTSDQGFPHALPTPHPHAGRSPVESLPQ